MKNPIWIAIAALCMTGCSDDSRVLLHDIQDHLNHSFMAVVLNLIDSTVEESDGASDEDLATQISTEIYTYYQSPPSQ